MQTRRRELFTTIRSEGAILPPELLERLASGDGDLRGLRAEDYHLVAGERVGEAINRSWNRLVGAWAGFRDALAAVPESDPATSVTRERWLLILFQELGYGRLQTARAVELDGRTYPVSHAWGSVPIHLVGAHVSLDHRTPGVAGAAGRSPHSMLQELLNRSDEHLWGFVSNGLVLRVLRDSSTLTRQAYLEFDLEGMLEGEIYSDFALLWLVCHESRVEGERPVECWLERWSQAAAEQGTRALEGLRQGVEEALVALGRGFLAHRANNGLREALRSGELPTQEYYRELLRLVYRLLFLFVAEDRELLFDPDADSAAKGRYERFYSTRRLRRLAERRRGTSHGDLWHALRLVMEALGKEGGCPPLALPALGGFLFSENAMPHLDRAEVANGDLLAAVRSLAFTQERAVRRVVDYRNLGSEELGSVYESLLELHPELDLDAASFGLTTAAGHERKTTGSYYTPSSLVQCLLDSALDPVLEEAASSADPEYAILDLKVCDPATGSGHFLVAAAHRIARRLAAVRTGEEEPSPEAVRTALRDVIGRCLYGVDVNPMAVELCKVSLWMEALEPGKPLSFLDAHIRCGNSLLGTTPELLATGIPDEAFKAIEGDDKKVASELRKRNKREREGQLALEDEVLELETALAEEAAGIEAAPDDSLAAVEAKARRFHDFETSPEYQEARLLADAWCAAFVQRKVEGAPLQITQGLLRRLASDSRSLSPGARDELDRLREEYRFFHWHVEFPAVFAGEYGGFDVVLGNPPWDQIQLDDREFFAVSRPDIAGAANMAARKRSITRLASEDPDLHRAYLGAVRSVEGVQQFVHASGCFPLTSYGRLNLAPLFAELMRRLIAATGRVGCIVPSGIATDSFSQFFFRELVERRALASLFDFRNNSRFFSDVADAQGNRFALLTLAGDDRPIPEGEFCFRADSLSELADHERRFTLASDDFALLNPNTGTCPIFRTRRDAELTKAVYRRVPVLVDESRGEDGNLWAFRGLLMFMMNTDSHLFHAEPAPSRVPLYEGKMVHQFHHRFGDYALATLTGKGVRQIPEPPLEALTNATFTISPRWWVERAEVEARLAGRWDRGWLLGWRDITAATLDTYRTVIAAVVPRVAVGDTFLLALPEAPAVAVACLLANLNSFALDYVARQKLGGTHLKYHVFKQLAVLPPSTFENLAPWASSEPLRDWLTLRVLELTYTGCDLEPLARDVGYDGPPFRWDPKRRFLLRCELDAAFFHLYGLERDDVAYVMDTFPIVRRRDEQAPGEYRTKRVILEIYDELAEAIATGRPYQTRLDPPPADPRVAHPPQNAAAVIVRP